MFPVDENSHANELPLGLWWTWLINKPVVRICISWSDTGYWPVFNKLPDTSGYGTPVRILFTRRETALE